MARLPPLLEISPRIRIPAAEITLSYARAGGPGGQHVNKTSSKVLLRWNLRTSEALGEVDRAWLEQRLASRLTESGDLLLSGETHREQSRNVEVVLARLVSVLQEALLRPKKRKKTRPSRGAKQRRLNEKKRRGDVKRQRRRPGGEE